MFLRIFLAAAAMTLTAGAASADTLNDQAPGLLDAATTLRIVEALHSLFAGFNAPTTWAVMLAGVAIVGLALRDRRNLNLGEI